MARQRRSEFQDVVLEEQAAASNIEPMDVGLGALLLFLIPGAVFIGLGIIGYPVSGKPKATFEQNLARKEKLKQRPPTALEEAEYQLRSKRVDTLINNYVPKYRTYSRKEEEPVPKHYFYECAQKCLQMAETELEQLQKEIKQSADLRPYEQSVASRLNAISQVRHDLLKEKVFLDR